jgi:hypothetical protein
MTDEQHAKAVQEAAEALIRAITSAWAEGIEVEIEALELPRINSVPVTTVSVTLRKRL